MLSIFLLFALLKLFPEAAVTHHLLLGSRGAEHKAYSIYGGGLTIFSNHQILTQAITLWLLFFTDGILEIPLQPSRQVDMTVESAQTALFISPSFNPGLQVMSPGVEGVSPLPLPVALLPPLWPGETVLIGPVCLIILITVRVFLSHGEGSVGEHLSQFGAEESLQAAACLCHLRVRLENRERGRYTESSDISLSQCNGDTIRKKDKENVDD